MGEVKLITGLALTVLFAIAISSYMFGFSYDNNAEVNLDDSGSGLIQINSTVRDQANVFKTQTNSSSDAFFESTIESGDEVMGSGGQFKIGMGSLVTGTSSIFTMARDRVFNGGGFGIIFTTISGLIVYIGFRYIYKSWVGKNPD